MSLLVCCHRSSSGRVAPLPTYPLARVCHGQPCRWPVSIKQWLTMVSLFSRGLLTTSPTLRAKTFPRKNRGQLKLSRQKRHEPSWICSARPSKVIRRMSKTVPRWAMRLRDTSFPARPAPRKRQTQKPVLTPRAPTGLHLPVLLLLMTHVSWSLSCSMSQSRARTQMVPVDSPPHRCLVILQPGCSTAITFRLRPKENDG